MARSSVGLLSCSFCGKSQKHVIKLIAGPGVYICDMCIDLCVEIMAEEKVHGDDDAVVTAAQRLRDDLGELRRLVLEGRDAP